MDVFVAVLLVVVGLAVILYGANFLVDGAVSLAYRFGISTAVVGLTIVAFGTSTPELAVSLASAFDGRSDMAIGNVVGSNIFNTLAILGFCALIRPLLISKLSLRYEIPLVVVSSLLLCILSLDSLFGNATTDVLSRGDGFVLLLFFLIFLSYTFAVAKSQDKDEEVATPEPIATNKQPKKMVSMLLVLGGLAMLVGGSKIFMLGAVDLAQLFGISDAVIGVTVAAVGTSLPELITSAVSVKKGQVDIAVNNVVGSNIFNILFILGSTASITPLMRGDIRGMDYLFLIGSAVALLIFSRFPKRGIITRSVGLFLLLTYIAYTTLLVYRTLGVS